MKYPDREGQELNEAEAGSGLCNSFFHHPLGCIWACLTHYVKKKRVFFHYLSKGFTCFYANTSMCLHHKMSVQVLYGYLVPVAEMDTWEFYILYRNILPRESKLLWFISRRDTKGLTTIWDCQGKELKWKPSLEGKMGLHGNKERVIKPLLSPIIQRPD